MDGEAQVGMVWLMKRMVVLGFLVVALLCAWTQSALGVWGDQYEDSNGGTGWRGVAGSIYLYDWTLAQGPPSGRIVNSIYVFDVNHNPYDAHWAAPNNFNDGYLDGTDDSQRHLEVGIDRGHFDDAYNWDARRWVFWQWSNNPDSAISGDCGQEHTYYQNDGDPQVWVTGFKIGNVTMTNSGRQTWHINWSGANPVTMAAPSLWIKRGRAAVSAERLWRGGDSPLAHFQGLQRKNDNADWSSWTNARPLADGDNQARFTKNSNTDLSHDWN